MPEANHKPAPGTVTALRMARASSEGRVLHVPVRRVIVRSPKRILREFVSVKMRAAVPCESSIELDHYTVLDVDPAVVAFRVQPEWVSYVDSRGKSRLTAPDVLVEFDDGTAEFHEVKPTGRTKEESEAIAATCAKRGLGYRVVQADEIRREPRLANARTLREARWRRPSPRASWAVRTFLADGGTAVLYLLVEALGPEGVSRADVLSLALRGQVTLDWKSRVIGPETSVSLPNR